jgi:hypothetical protein
MGRTIKTFDKIGECVILASATTGKWENSAKWVEVCAVRTNLQAGDNLPIEVFHSYVNTTGTIKPEATQIHGLSKEDLADSPGVKEVAPKLREFIGDRTIVAFNADFHVQVLINELGYAKAPDVDKNPVACALSRIRDYADAIAKAEPDEPKMRCDLNSIVTSYGQPDNSKARPAALWRARETLFAAQLLSQLDNEGGRLHKRFDEVGFNPHAAWKATAAVTGNAKGGAAKGSSSGCAVVLLAPVAGAALSYLVI